MKPEYTRRRFGALVAGLAGTAVPTSARASQTAGAAKTDYYIAPSGDDSNGGTKRRPFATLDPIGVDEPTEATDEVMIHIRGGTYEWDTHYDLRRDGKKMTIEAYGTERPVLDFAGYAGDSQSPAAIRVLESDGPEIRGLEVKNAPGRGIRASNCSDPVIERCVTHHCGNSGITISDGVGGTVHGCESFGNVGPRPDGSGSVAGGNADGFQFTASPGKSTPHQGALVERCIAHHNSDDGFDFARTVGIEIRYSQAYSNGYDMQGIRTGEAPGSGIKLGVTSFDGDGDQRCYRNAAWYNGAAGIKFNGADLPCDVYNNTCFDNSRKHDQRSYIAAGDDYSFHEAHPDSRVYNNVGQPSGNVRRIASENVVTNSWQLGTTFENAGFQSVAVDAAGNPEQPAQFLRPGAGSPLIDGGTPVPELDVFAIGPVPDVGRYEYSTLQSKYDHTIVFDSRSGTGDYEFTVSGEVVKSVARGARKNAGDTISNSTVTGRVSGGRDSYVFNGEIESINVDSGITVLLDGRVYPPTNVSKSLLQ
jgi:hypothetical protein